MTHAPTLPAPQRSTPAHPARKRLFIQTYGCQANVYDSGRMADVLAPHGYALVDSADGADLVIINTCHIREKATEKLYSDLGRLRAQRNATTNRLSAATIVVAGCVAQAEGAEIVRRAPVVDFVIGPQSYHRLPELLARATGERFLGDFTPDEKFDALPAPTASGVTGFVAVQEGCDKFCTFCVVPYTRGAEWSRPMAQVEAEVRALAAQGVREVTLLGQNVNAWHGAGPSGEDSSFDALLRRLASIESLERLRYTTSHPLEMTDALIDLHGAEPKLMPFLHLPVQSGSDRVLRAMNRRHTAADYLRTIARLRAVRPDIAISTDLIVGFPGETDAEFEDTLALVNEVKFCAAYSFKYSRRAGTPAAGLARQVAEDVADARLQRLQAVLRTHQLAFNAAHIGRTLSVLVTAPGRHEGQMIGKSPYFQSVHFDGPLSLAGKLVEVSISGAGLNSVSGDFVRILS